MYISIFVACHMLEKDQVYLIDGKPAQLCYSGNLKIENWKITILLNKGMQHITLKSQLTTPFSLLNFLILAMSAAVKVGETSLDNCEMLLAISTVLKKNSQILILFPFVDCSPEFLAISSNNYLIF